MHKHSHAGVLDRVCLHVNTCTHSVSQVKAVLICSFVTLWRLLQSPSDCVFGPPSIAMILDFDEGSVLGLGRALICLLTTRCLHSPNQNFHPHSTTPARQRNHPPSNPYINHFSTKNNRKLNHQQCNTNTVFCSGEREGRRSCSSWRSRWVAGEVGGEEVGELAIAGRVAERQDAGVRVRRGPVLGLSRSVDGVEVASILILRKRRW